MVVPLVREKQADPPRRVSQCRDTLSLVIVIASVVVVVVVAAAAAAAAAKAAV